MIKLLAKKMKRRMKSQFGGSVLKETPKSVFKDILPTAFVFPFTLQ
jgi:hypothetical protein